jgi:cytochrome P450
MKETTSMSLSDTPLRCPFADAPSYPFRRNTAHPLNPPVEFESLRRERPISQVTLWNGQKVWLVTRYDDAQAVLSDPRFSSVPANPGYPTLSQAIAASRRADASFLRMDRPKHTEHRRMWTPFFAIKRIQDMRPGIQAIVDETLSAMLAEEPPVDFVEKFALTVPSLVICQLLDVPRSAHAFFHQHSKTRMAMNGTPENILKAMQALDEFWESLITEREKNPGEDLVSQLIVNEVKTGRLSKRELISMAQLMLLAGHETTANMIALGTLTLLRHPQQLARLKADKTLTPSAVDELLRYLSVAQHGLGRTAIADIEIGEVMIRAGEGVLVVVAAANRDEAVFAEPDRLDIGRQARHHLAFGASIHQCIGHPLARAELQIVFDTLFARVPTLRVAVPDEQIPYKYESLFFGVHALPVTW